MDVGLDESVAVTDADGDHWVYGDTVGGQMAEDREREKKFYEHDI